VNSPLVGKWFVITHVIEKVAPDLEATVHNLIYRFLDLLV